MSRHQSLVLVTVGQKPKEVLVAIDSLMSAGDSPDELHLIFQQPQINRCKEQFVDLLSILKRDPTYQSLKVEKHDISVEWSAPNEMQSSANTAYLWERLNGLVTELKSSGSRLNMVVGEGQTVLGMLLMTTANLHFYPYDKLWQQTARQKLIQIPVIPLGSLFIGLRNIPSRPFRQMGVDLQTEQNCREVLDRLTPRQTDVLLEFAKGKRPAEVAAELSLTLATVDSHKAQIFRAIRDVWQMAADKRLDFRFLYETFSHLEQL